MLWYENINKEQEQIYPNLQILINENLNLYSDECIVFCINGGSGFGSQLTLLTQYGLYLQKINPKIHCLGHFSINNHSFKYHDMTLIIIILFFYILNI
jgi:hypothetical protein